MGSTGGPVSRTPSRQTRVHGEPAPSCAPSTSPLCKPATHMHEPVSIGAKQAPACRPHSQLPPTAHAAGSLCFMPLLACRPAAGPTLQPAQQPYPAAGNMAGAVGVIPAAGPQPGPAPYGGAHAPVQPAINLHKQLPGLLADFISQLPPARSLQGLHPDVDQVRDQ